MRPGAIYNADENTARMLVERGYAMRVVEPAPLFVDSTAAPGKPKKAKRRDSTDGSINDGTHNPSRCETVSRDHGDNIRRDP
jgi:hypothetical protein